jgi:Phosphodiester glycosidase
MNTIPAQYRHQAPPAGQPRRPRRTGLRGVLAALLVVAAVLLLAVGTSLWGAWRTPGNQSFEAKWADWLRSHHAAVLANTVERYYYSHNQPPKGGEPARLNPVPSLPAGAAVVSPTVGRVSPTTRKAAPAAPAARTAPAAAGTAPAAVGVGLPPPRPVPLVVSPALPGEGAWTPAGASVGGQPAMYVAQFRADTIYTSQITSAVWIDPTRLRVALVPGTQEPGGTWAQPPDINGAALSTIVAAFNGGFRMQDAHGGFYLEGRQQVPLRPGAASVVIYRGGRVNIGTWGAEVTMTPQVVAVLQNLVPIVDNGQVAPNATYNDTRLWGATLGAHTVVARSGIGITASGALLYVAGPALTARSLAESLQRAGAVRAMALDINPEWVTFNFYTHPSPANPSSIVPAKLYPQMRRSASRYLGPTRESRDFFSVSLPVAG